MTCGGRGWVPAFARTTEGRAPARDAPTEMPGGEGMVRGDGEGRPYGDAEGEGEESVIGSEIPRLGFAASGMTMALGKPPKGMKMDSV